MSLEQKEKVINRLNKNKNKNNERINKNIKNNSNKSYFKILIEVLKKETPDKTEDVKELFKKWISIGKREEAKKFLNDNSININLPQDKASCSCTHYIVNNYFILNYNDDNKENYKILTIGSCCIKKFISNNTTTFKCIKCDVLFKSKRKRNENICDLCIIDYDKEMKERKKIKTCFKCNKTYTKDRKSLDYLCYECKKDDIKYKKINEEIITKVRDLNILKTKINNLKKYEPDKKYKLQSYDTNENINRLINKCLLKQNNNYHRDKIIGKNYIDITMFNLEIRNVQYFKFLDFVNKKKLHKKLNYFSDEYDTLFDEDDFLIYEEKVNKFLKGEFLIGFGKYKNEPMKNLKDYGYINWIKRVFKEGGSCERMMLAGCYFSYFK